MIPAAIATAVLIGDPLGIKTAITGVLNKVKTALTSA